MVSINLRINQILRHTILNKYSVVNSTKIRVRKKLPIQYIGRI